METENELKKCKDLAKEIGYTITVVGPKYVRYGDGNFLGHCSLADLRSKLLEVKSRRTQLKFYQDMALTHDPLTQEQIIGIVQRHIAKYDQDIADAEYKAEIATDPEIKEHYSAIPMFSYKKRMAAQRILEDILEGKV
jgi:hypothetical protein